MWTYIARRFLQIIPLLLGISALLGITLVSLVGLLQRVLAPWQRTGLASAGEEG